ncbi:MAG: hypothetical protein J7J14_02300 [Thermotogaceae bacterium]|nr:hypothetical protein [Thermotogaceae bacterium]
MKLIINGKKSEVPPEEFKTLGELIEKIKKDQRSQVLKSVVLDGEEIPLSRLEEFSGITLKEDTTVELIFTSLRSFLLEALEEVISYINRVMELLPKVSNSVISGSPEGYRSINDLAEGLNAMETLRVDTIKISGLRPEELGLIDREKDVVKILKNFVEALNNKDVVEISDMIESDIPKVFSYYKEFFTRAKEILEMKES